MRIKPRKSIVGQVNTTTWLLTFVLVLPAIISLVAMLVYAVWYQSSVSRMETIAALKPMVSTQIPELVWTSVSGRVAFEDCGVYEVINQVNTSLDQLAKDGSPNDNLELIIARRTMETLTQYVRIIEDNLATHAPIVESEHTLEEVRNVAALVESMLEDDIASEITRNALNNARMTSTVLISAGVEVFLLILAMLLAANARRKIARAIREPIGRLEHFAGLMAAGTLEARVPPTDLAELENLTEGINIMADRLGSLIRQSRLEQENLRKSELRILQAQINPHFLYNTLDTIIWQAEAGRSTEVIAITRALSDFFRISLSSGEDWIPVSQEIKHLAGYLSIQKTRYRDILTYEIDVDESIHDAMILKLLLQPLVENALYHGIKYKRGGGQITVTGKQTGEYLSFSVSDSGKGMTAEQLSDVYARMRGEKPPQTSIQNGSGFGLNNVDQRIRLYYGQSEGLCIQSNTNGTTVTFRVPIKGKEVSDNDQGYIG